MTVAVLVGDPVEWKETFDRLNRENLDLRRMLKVEEGRRTSTAHRLQEAERRVRDLSDNYWRHNAEPARSERRLADVRSTYEKTLTTKISNSDGHSNRQGVPPRNYRPRRRLRHSESFWMRRAYGRIK